MADGTLFGSVPRLRVGDLFAGGGDGVCPPVARAIAGALVG